MDVHDGLDSNGTHGAWEPPGHAGSSASTGEDTHGYSGTGHSAGGYDDATTGSGDAADSADGSTAGSASASGSASGSGSGSAAGSGFRLPGSAAGSASGSASGDTGGTEGSTTMTVEVEGETRQLPAEHDYTGDGRPDAAVETEDGKVIVFADNEDNATGAARPDGRADEAYIVDKSTGQVVGAAHIDPATGTWIEGPDPDGPGGARGDGGSSWSGGQPSGGVVTDDYDAGLTDHGSTDGGSTDGGSTDGGSTGGAGTTTGTMTVDMGGRIQQLPAEQDYTGDGRPDAAARPGTVTVIVFADTATTRPAPPTPTAGPTRRGGGQDAPAGCRRAHARSPDRRVGGRSRPRPPARRAAEEAGG